MAFLEEEIGKLSKREPPASISDCLKTDILSQTLWEWAQSIENLGRIVLGILIICGIVVTVFTGMSTSQEYGSYISDDEGIVVIAATILAALQWGLYAFIEYCVYHATALLMGALASIVQSNRISSDLAVYNAGLIQESIGIGEQSSNKHFSVEDLGELAKKKAQGLISDTEYEIQRNEILKHL